MMNALRTINPEQMGAIIRTLFQMIGAALGMYGLMTDEDWLALSGPAASLAILGWGVWARSDANLLVSAANVPTVDRVVVSSSEVAQKVPDRKVTTAFALLLPLLLVGCQTEVVRKPTIVQTVVANSPEAVQQFVRDNCGWIEPIVNIVAIMGNVGGIGATAAEEICAAVNQPRELRRGVIAVRGIALRGQRVPVK